MNNQEESNEAKKNSETDKKEKEGFHEFTSAQNFDTKRSQTQTHLHNKNFEILEKLRPSNKNTLLLERLKNFSLNSLNNHTNKNENLGNNMIRQTHNAFSIQNLIKYKNNKQANLLYKNYSCNKNDNFDLEDDVKDNYNNNCKNENFFLNTSTSNRDLILNNPVDTSTCSLYLDNENNDYYAEKAQKYPNNPRVCKVSDNSNSVNCNNNNKPLLNKSDNLFGNNNNNFIYTNAANTDFTDLICQTENNIITMNAQDEVFKKIYQHSRGNSKGSHNSFSKNNYNFKNSNISKNNNPSNFAFSKNKQKNILNYLHDSEINCTNNTIKTSCGGVSLHTNANTSLNLAWINILKKSNAELNNKQVAENAIAENSGFLGVNESNIQNENSVFSENFNFEDFNRILSEENFNGLINENSFSNSESHSILPFFLLFSREIHRMCISDYEIKLICKKFKLKQKTKRLDWIDFYKKGIIKVYQAKYFEAFQYFKEAETRKTEEIEVKKWISFVLILIIFCADLRKSREEFNKLVEFNQKNKSNSKGNDSENTKEGECCKEKKNNFSNKNNEGDNFDANFYASFFINTFKIDFESLRSVEIKNEEIDYSAITEARDSDEENENEGNSSFFGCCNSRKPSKKNRHNKSTDNSSLIE